MIRFVRPFGNCYVLGDMIYDDIVCGLFEWLVAHWLDANIIPKKKQFYSIIPWHIVIALPCTL